MKRLTVLLVASLALPGLGEFPEICEGCWYEVPNSEISDVFPGDSPPGGSSRAEAIVTGNGGAFDVRRNQLIVKGGGAFNAGNEIYAFNLDSLKWFRIVDPAGTYDPDDDLSPYYFNGGLTPDDQQPRPGGNFDAIEYDSTSDNLFIFGSPHPYQNSTTWSNIFQLNMSNLTWSSPDEITSAINYGGSVSARDPATGKIWFFGNGGGGYLSSFNPSSGILTDHGDFWGGQSISSYQTAAIMPPKNRMISIGWGSAVYWDLVTSGNSYQEELLTTDCDSLMAVDAPGFEWSPVDNKMIGWMGGTKVYTMDTTYTCEEVEAHVSNTVDPGSPAIYGSFGRWRYVPKYNVFVVVSSATGSVYLYRHSAAPPTTTVEITSPADNFLTNQGTIAVAWEVNAVSQTTQLSEVLELEGENLVIRCSDDVCDTITVIRDQTPPAVIITSPASSYITTASSIMVKWTIDAVPDSQVYALNPGTNLIIVTSDPDAAGNIGADTISVTRGVYVSGMPVFPSGADLIASNIRSTSMTLTWTAATAASGLKEYLIFGNKALMARVPGNQTTYNVVGLLYDTVYEFRVEALDSINQLSINGPMRNFRTKDVLPPDPVTVASAIPNSQPTLLASSVAFLYQGINPTQTGQIDSLMDPVRAVVLRGAVRNRAGTMLPGVTVSVLNHDEVGSTLTRTDGLFNMVVNGGAELTVRFEAAGYLEAQRTVRPRWQEYVVMDTVTLVAMDTLVTTVNLSPGQPMQAVQASIVTDASGSRQATLLIPTNTEASLLLPDGTTQPLDSMRVRTTEYTVGPSGPSAMPGKLPASSAYTYAVEYSVEEAIAAGAEGVVFENPIYGYVENFVDIPVGQPVPTAIYDKRQGIWIPTDDGRVIKIAAINAGKADLVVDVSGTTATDDHLDSIGITDAERIKLADLYAVDQTLWRVPVRHFSSADYNFPVRLPDGAGFPNAESPGSDGEPGTCETKQGSIIDCHRQSLGETVRFPGLPSMNYRSHRVPSRRWNRLEIAVTGSTIPEDVDRILLDVVVAGQKFQYAYSPATNITQVVEWNGLDVFGRELRGRQPYSYSISFGYVVVYAPPPPLPRVGSTGSFDLTARTFGMPSSGGGFPGGQTARILYDLSDTYTGYIGTSNIGDFGPGWTLENHHVYDPTSGTLHRGDGTEERVRTGLGAIYTVAGGGESWPDGVPGKQAQFGNFNEIDVGPDGSIYAADRSNDVIWKIDKDGFVRAAVSGETWTDVDAAADGSLYLTGLGENQVWKLSKDGELTVFAGNGSAGFSGDGGPATDAELDGPNGAVMGPDGSLYIADRNNSRVRKVNPDGIIQTVAGTGTTFFNGVSMPATSTNMNVNHLAVAADGSIYVSDVANYVIWKIDPSGISSIVAGNGSSGTLGDGGPALEAQVTADRVEVANTKDGGTLIYLSDELNNTIRVVDEKGIINRIAGGGADEATDGIPATSATIFEPRGLAVDATGNVYIGEFFSPSPKVRKIIGKFPDFSNRNILIPSTGSGEVYQFSQEGRHLKTFNAFTGKELLEFTYNGAGQLTHVTDAYGNVTEIERDLAGLPTALVNPYNQTLELDMDEEGNLSEVTLPSSSTHEFSYNELGLLESYLTPREKEYLFTYDSLGRLTRDDDPAGGFQTLTREDTTFGVKTTIVTAMDRENIYKLLDMPDLSNENISIDPAGVATRTVISGGGLVTTYLPDTTTIVSQLGPEPQFTMQSRLARTTTTTLPSSLERVIEDERVVTFADPLDPLTLETYLETWTDAGVTSSRFYVDSIRTWINNSAMGRTDTTRIDSLGRIVERSTPGTHKIFYTYDNRGRLDSIIQGAGLSARTAYLTYNAEGYLLQIENSEGYIREFSYNPDGSISQETLPDGREVDYTYDADGNVESIAPPGRPAHFFEYNAVGLDTLYEPPSLGVGIWNVSDSYNLDRQLLTINRPSSLDLAFRYDAGGRLDSILSSGGAHVFHHNATTARLDSLISPQGLSLSYLYDGFLPTSVAWSGEVSGSVEVTYDSRFQILFQSVNGGDPIFFLPDPDGLPLLAGDMWLTHDNDNGRLIETSLNDVVDSVFYSAFGEVVEYLAFAEGDTIFHSLYDRDRLGRIIQKTETVAGLTKVHEYRYDSSGRLDEVELNNVLVSEYSYDSNGNRIARAHSGGIDSGFYDDQDRMTHYGSAAYYYHSDGNLEKMVRSGDTTSYRYDEFGNLLEVLLPNGDQIEYLHDGQNRRVGKKVNGVLQQGFLYAGQLSPIAELDSAGSVVSQFIYGGAKRNVPAYLIKGNDVYRILSDHLGSVRLVVDSETGAIVQAIEYDEFGNVLSDSNPGFQPFGFAGGLYDFSTGLVRFGVRDFNAFPGRWTNKDPAGFSAGLNHYVYVENDPINKIDPTGLDLIVITGGVRDGSNNIFGHVGVAIQGYGMASYGNEYDLGSSVWDYILSQSSLRNQQITIIPTTPEQDELARQYVRNHPDQKGIGLFDNCSNRTNQMLKAAGIPIVNTPFPGGTARNVQSIPGTRTFFMPRGSPVPRELVDILWNPEW